MSFNDTIHNIILKQKKRLEKILNNMDIVTKNNIPDMKVLNKIYEVDTAIEDLEYKMIFIKSLISGDDNELLTHEEKQELNSLMREGLNFGWEMFKDFFKGNPSNIELMNKYLELKRVRYTTSHPLDMTEDLIECYSSNKKLMPFIHLPIQSGSNKILKLMNRKHIVEDYLNVYNKLIKINPLIKLSSDFIVGYPGEDKYDFDQTIKLVKEIKFINSFSFIFSPRPGTKASKLEVLDKVILKDRLIELQSYLFQNQINHNKSLENKDVEVLVENKIKDQDKFFGRNEYFNSVIFEGKNDDIGKIIKVNIENTNKNTLFGKIKTKMKAA